MRRVVLIGVGSGDKVEGSSHGATWPHLGILTVGSAIADLGGEVILYDENIEGPIPSGVISSEDIVGLSVVAPSVDRGLYLASQIKKCGATVFMGNDGAASRAYQILSRYPEVDGVFLGDDLAAVKKVFSSITRNEYLPKNEVSGFAQRKQSGGIMVSPSLVFHDLSNFPIPKFSLFPKVYWEKVWDNHRRTNGFEYSKPRPESIKNCNIMLASGCVHARNACHYCAISHASQLRCGNERYVRKLIDAYKQFGVNSFYEICDDLLGFRSLICRLKAWSIKFPHFTCYARASSANSWNIEELFGLVEPDGHLKFNIGLDSGDDMILRRGINKGSGLNENIKIVRLMKEFGIWAHFSFIFGSPGETKTSCQRTLDFIQWVFDTMGQLIANIEADIWWVNYGAPCDQIFVDYNFACHYATMAGKQITYREWQNDFFAYRDSIVVPWEVQKNWYRWFTNIDINYAEECIAKVRQGAAQNNTNFGRAYGLADRE